MRTMTHKQMTKIICYFLAASFSFTHVVNASSAFLDNPKSEAAEMDHKCTSISPDLTTGSILQHQAAMKGALNMDCEHGATCKILCSISLSVPYPESIDASGFDRSNQWLLVDTPSFTSSFPSLLDRPPKS